MRTPQNDAPRVLVADFETRAGRVAVDDGRTWVWAWAVCSIDDIDHVTTGTSIESFFDFLRYQGNIICYFHNLKFDGSFLLNYLYSHGYKKSNKRGLEIGEIGELIDAYGKFFCIRVRFSQRCSVEFRDSAKKIPCTVERMGEAYCTRYQKLKMPMGYDYERKPGGTLTQAEIDYVANDVRVVAEVLGRMYADGYDRLTIGADCVAKYSSFYGGSRFQLVFPRLEKEEDDFIRKAYRGGWCYTNPAISGDIVRDVRGYDVNSLYPYVMHSSSGNFYPTGEGVKFEGKYEPDRRHPLYVQRLRCIFTIKQGFFPFISVKNAFWAKATDYPEDSLGEVELTLTSVDLEMFFRAYDVTVTEWLGGYKYEPAKGLFDKYINYFYDIKKGEKGAKREIAKLFLNNLGGKFALAPDVRKRESYWNEAESKLKFRDGILDHRHSLYIPVAAFMTSYARRVTVTAAIANREHFCYSDTDSLYLTADAVGIECDPVELGRWKQDPIATEAKFIRQKCYVKHMCGGEWVVTISGMTKPAKAEFIRRLEAGEMTLDDFRPGMRLEGAQVKSKTVSGGTVLYNSDYTLNE